jgi:hypothetical protein
MPCATIKHTRGDMERTAEAFRILAAAWCGAWPFTPRAWQLDCLACGDPTPVDVGGVRCPDTQAKKERIMHNYAKTKKQIREERQQETACTDWMHENAWEHEDDCGEVDATGLAEAWADEHGATLDEHHVAWTIAAEVATECS